jgi:hypothetical protein
MVMMALRPAVMRRNRRHGGDQAVLAASLNRVNVTKGHAEIDDQRQQREP